MKLSDEKEDLSKTLDEEHKQEIKQVFKNIKKNKYTYSQITNGEKDYDVMYFKIYNNLFPSYLGGLEKEYERDGRHHRKSR